MLAPLPERRSELDCREVRDATLVLLYRLLFILFAEDRDLLPVRDDRYDNYSLRNNVCDDIGRRKEEGDVFSTTAARYWSTFDDLCRSIDLGDSSIGLPPYDGGLFERDAVPLLARVRLDDAAMAEVVDALSFEHTPEGRRYINYRDLGVQQLGSIYERLLEQEVVRDGDGIIVRPNTFARKDSGSYYTPDDLVRLIIEETIGPLAASRMTAFSEKAAELSASSVLEHDRMGRLKRLDPAERLLELKICDPAMGSGHFLVQLVDHLADQVISAMAESEAIQDGYISPLSERIEGIRNTIIGNAEDRDWTVDTSQLDDRHIVRRMVLKRCVYGVDKTPMAVELAKVFLWLHTFTVGAPLSFLDHHLRCGDSLFGTWVRSAIEKSEQQARLFVTEPLKRATRAAASMQVLEGLTDAEIAEAHRSADIFAEVSDMTAPLSAFLSLLHSFDWLDPRNREDKAAYLAWLEGAFGDPIEIAQGKVGGQTESNQANRFASLLDQARELVAGERFLHWQVAFPGVWSEWEGRGRTGGFDAVIGNPPWDRMKMQEVEWFAFRRPEIAMAPRAADRKRMIADLREANDPLAREYALARDRALMATRVARRSGQYPLLSRGDRNLYALFVERAMSLVKPDGMVGLLVPSGIASDKTAARFFNSVATEGRLKALYDFENRRRDDTSTAFFPDVDSRFKFCVLVASPSTLGEKARCAFYLHDIAFYLHDIAELDDPERCILLEADTFVRVNPNTGTAPIFRRRRDAELATAVYGLLPVLADRSSRTEAKAWPVKYQTMFHMTNDSEHFRTRTELEETEGAWPIGGNRYDSPKGSWVPLYEGKMVQAFDHRAASIVVNPSNVHRPAQPEPAGLEQHQDPNWYPDPRYWVLRSRIGLPASSCLLGFKDITSPTNARSMIAALIPGCGAGNTFPILWAEGFPARDAALLLANFNALAFDYVARQKIQGQHLNWFIVEQLPVVPPAVYEAVRFGDKTAGEIVREAVLELTYMAHDMVPFARDMGHVDAEGFVPAPFSWNEDRRQQLRAKLDALYFSLYGVIDRDDIQYVFSTFPILKREEEKRYGTFRSREACVAWMNALAAGEPDAIVDL